MLFFKFFAVLFLGLSLLSCQKEEEEHIDETQEETITASSPLTTLLLRTSQNPGTYDDIIDGNGCASVVLPITVVANGQQVTVNTPEDVLLILQIFNQFPNDTDTLQINFPITLELFDFTQVTVNSQVELDALAASCGANEVEIGCLDIVYPISFFTYNADQQQTGTVTINNDIELYSFLQNLGPDDFISLDFPISVVLEDGSTTEVSSHTALQTLITDCVANGGGDPIDISQFEEDLTTGVWYVAYFFDDYDETDNYAGYEFTFALDGTAQTVKAGVITAGTWALVDDFKIDLFFGTTDPLDELDEDWEILEATAEIITLKHISGDGSTDFLTFSRNPNTGGNNTELNLFIENLITGNWYVNLLEENGTDHTSNFDAYEFTFFGNGSATAVSNGNTINGFWTAEVNSGNLDFIMNFETSTNGDFAALNDDWKVLEATQTIIRLSDVSGGGGGTDYLTFGREPNGGGGGGPDPQELRDILVSGTWYVEKFLDDGGDETSDFNGYDFNFYNNETVFASNGSEYVYGIWIITVTGTELNFEFDMDSPINGADDDEYKALQYTTTSVTFITRNSQGEIEDTLIFKKN